MRWNICTHNKQRNVETWLNNLMFVVCSLCVYVFEKWNHVKSPLTSKNSNFSILVKKKKISRSNCVNQSICYHISWCTLFQFSLIFCLCSFFVQKNLNLVRTHTHTKMSEYVKISLRIWNYFYAIYILYSVSMKYLL